MTGRTPTAVLAALAALSVSAGTAHAAAPRVGTPSVVRVTPTTTGVDVRVRCAGAAGVQCSLRVVLEAGLTTSSAAKRNVVVPEGVSTVRLTMVPAAQALLSQYGELGAVVVVDQYRSGRSYRVARRALTLTADGKPLPTVTGAATVTRVATLNNGANIYVRCAGPSNAACRVSFSLAAGLSSGKAAEKVVTVGAGITRVTLTLVPAAQQLLNQYGALHGTLTVDQRVGSQLKQVAQPSFTMHS